MIEKRKKMKKVIDIHGIEVVDMIYEDGRREWEIMFIACSFGIDLHRDLFIYRLSSIALVE